jgi:hypothetical protein
MAVCAAISIEMNPTEMFMKRQVEAQSVRVNRILSNLRMV